MTWDDKENTVNPGGSSGSIFDIQGELAGEGDPEDFLEREQFIGLLIDKEEFLLPIASVKEILMLKSITFVPGAHEFIDGVLNIRGTILPAINLRKMMGLTRSDPSPANRIIVVKHGDISVGLIVDGVTYVLSLLPDEIENRSISSKGVGADLIGGVSRRNEVVNGILDLGKIIASVAGGKDLSEDQDEEESA